MNRKRDIKKILTAGLVMLVGTGSVMALVLTMNSFGGGDREIKESRTTEFVAAVKQKPKKVQPKKKAPPKRKAQKSSKAPPPPVLSAGMGSAAIGLPGFGDGALLAGADQLLKNFKTGVMTEEAVDKKPRALRRAAVEYPKRARAKGIEGMVEMSSLINERGEIESIRVVDSFPEGIFDDAAKTTVEKWEFEPARYEGAPVKVWAKQTVKFNLS